MSAAPDRGRALRAAGRAVVVAAALLLFVLGLELVKFGAGGVAPALETFKVMGAVNTIGLGWILACLVLSGSPVAAIAISLFSVERITEVETLGMVAGSRFGAAYVVLLLGTIHLLRGRHGTKAVATGVLCLLVTWSVLAPAVVVSYTFLWSGVLGGLYLPIPGWLAGLSDRLYGPFLGLLSERLPAAALFIAGVVTLLGSFSLFDRALPALDPKSSRFRQIAFVIYRPAVMFLLGALITCLTLSVSVSLGLLIPLSAKGWVRRENIVPYIMGANVSTFVDTLAASILVGEPKAFAVVMALMLGVAIFSFVIVASFYASYRDGLEWALRRITSSRRSFLIFLAAILIVPLLLTLL